MRNKDKDKGYSFIELLIVIAIMAILAGASIMTLGVVNRARAKAVSTELDNQIGVLLSQTNAQSANTSMLIKLLDNPNKIGTDESYCYSFGKIPTTSNDASAYTISGDSTWFSNRVVIEYLPEDSSQSITGNTSSNPVYLIQYNKSDGSIRKGAGTYVIHEKASSNTDYSGSIIAKVVLNASTGNHYIK